MTTKTIVTYNKDQTWNITVIDEDGIVRINQTVVFEGLTQLAMLALLTEVTRYQEREKLWTSPTPEMVQAGLSEVQNQFDEWLSSSGGEAPTDKQASDFAVFVLQAMANKLPKL
nr:MAG: hypothetical protein [Bacteriophage sp.]